MNERFERLEYMGDVAYTPFRAEAGYAACKAVVDRVGGGLYGASPLDGRAAVVVLPELRDVFMARLRAAAPDLRPDAAADAVCAWLLRGEVTARGLAMSEPPAEDPIEVELRAEYLERLASRATDGEAREIREAWRAERGGRCRWWLLERRRALVWG